MVCAQRSEVSWQLRTSPVAGGQWLRAPLRGRAYSFFLAPQKIRPVFVRSSRDRELFLSSEGGRAQHAPKERSVVRCAALLSIAMSTRTPTPTIPLHRPSTTGSFFQGNANDSFNHFMDVRDTRVENYAAMKSYQACDGIVKRLAESPSRDPYFPRYIRLPDYLRGPSMRRERSVPERALHIEGMHVLAGSSRPGALLPPSIVLTDQVGLRAQQAFREEASRTVKPRLPSDFPLTLSHFRHLPSAIGPTWMPPR